MHPREMESQRRVWQGVIVQAIRDATSRATRTTRDRKETRHARREARAWLHAGGDDFQHVCALAGINPAALQAWWRSIEERTDMSDEQDQRADIEGAFLDWLDFEKHSPRKVIARRRRGRPLDRMATMAMCRARHLQDEGLLSIITRVGPTMITYIAERPQ